MDIRNAGHRDREAWLEVRRTLWPLITVADHEKEIAAGIAGEDGRCFVVMESGRQQVALLECRIRTSGEGEDAQTEGWLEGWYIAPRYRKGGVGKGVFQMLRQWFDARGCSNLKREPELERDVFCKANRLVDPPESPALFDFARRSSQEGR